MPAVQMYDLARAHIARGLNSGGVRVLWNQFTTGPFIPMPYKGFDTVFDRGWIKYDPFAEDCGPMYTLHRPEGKPIKRTSLSYAYAEEHKVFSIHLPFDLIIFVGVVQRNTLSPRHECSPKLA